MATPNELVMDATVAAAFARELARVCPGWSGAVVTVYGPEDGCVTSLRLYPAGGRPTRLPAPAAELPR